MIIVKQTLLRRLLISIVSILVAYNCAAQQRTTNVDSMLCLIIIGDNFSNDTMSLSLNGEPIFEEVELTTYSYLGLGITPIWAEIREKDNCFFLETTNKKRKINIDPNKIELSFLFKRQKINYTLQLSNGKYLIVDRYAYDKLNFIQRNDKPVFD